MTLLDKMKEIVPKLTEREKDIYAYLLEHPDKVSEYSARELGNVTFTSAASVTRFCQKIGCKGYPDFRLRFLSELQEIGKYAQTGDTVLQLNAQENVFTLLRKVAEVEHRAVDETRRELDMNALIRAAQQIIHAQHVDFYAYDSSACIAEYACNQFYFAGKRAQVYRDTNMQGLNASLPNSGHVAVIISHTGRNARLIALSKLLRRSGTPVIAITSGRHSPQAQNADEVLLMAGDPHSIDEFWVARFASAAKFLLDLLANMVFSVDYNGNMQRNTRYERFGSDALWKLTGQDSDESPVERGRKK